MKRVFVVQVPARRSPSQRGQWEEKYDLEPAREFGELVRVLDYGNVPEDPTPTRDRIRSVMGDFDWELDSLLLLGDPVACAQAVHFIGQELDLASFTVLKWDRREARYAPYRVG